MISLIQVFMYIKNYYTLLISEHSTRENAWYIFLTFLFENDEFWIFADLIQSSQRQKMNERHSDIHLNAISKKFSSVSVGNDKRNFNLCP